MIDQDRYLYKRAGRWHYQRRVPSEYAKFDSRRYIRKALKTNKIDVARMRRDAMVLADDEYWEGIAKTSIILGQRANGSKESVEAVKRYERAKRIAMAKGFVYTSNSELISQSDISVLLSRIDALSNNNIPKQVEAEAVLGIAPKPKVSINQAFELYCDKICMSELLGKSDFQKKSWRKVKYRSVLNFVDLHGDMAMDEITRVEARSFYNWWSDRLVAKGDERARMPNTANRDLGNLRKLFQKYWEYEGEEDRQNPFRKLNFKEIGGKDVPHFDDGWVRENILKPEVFENLNTQAVLLTYALIETGCRPSELANILEENIVLDHEVPHVRIRRQENRELKTSSSIRDIPLVGVSLIAMKLAKTGFPHYQDKGNLLSVSLLKAFRRRNLFPSKDHRIYSFRHSFEKRMLEANLDYGLRCLLMGHKNSRPSYGDGGSLEYRRDELLKFTHPVPQSFEKNLSELIKPNC